jgi:hypothetical protein
MIYKTKDWATTLTVHHLYSWWKQDNNLQLFVGDLIWFDLNFCV